MAKVTKETIEEQIQHLDPKLEKTDEAYRVASIMLLALQVGANSDKIAKFLKLDKGAIGTLKTKYEPNLRKSKIWNGEKTSCEWFEKDGGIAFWCDVSVAMGLLERSQEITNAKK